MSEHAPCGVNWELEAKADELLAEDRRGVSSITDRQFWYTEDQWRNRYSHEVYVPGGFPDPRLLRGVYGRVYNPSINSRPTKQRRFTTEMDPWKQFLYEEMDPAPGWYLPGAFVTPGSGPTQGKTNYIVYRKKMTNAIMTEDQVTPNGVDPKKTEQWREVVGYPKYQISDRGHPRSFHKQGRYGGEPEEGYPLKTNVQGDRLVVWLRNPNKPTSGTDCLRIDRLVLEAFVGPAPGPTYGPAHQNDDPMDCRLENLYWKEGLVRPRKKPKPMKKKVAQAITVRKKPGPKPGIKRTPVKAVPTGVREQRIFYSDSIEVLWNVTEGTIDLSQSPKSTPIIRLDQVDDLIDCLKLIQAEGER